MNPIKIRFFINKFYRLSMVKKPLLRLSIIALSFVSAESYSAGNSELLDKFRTDIIEEIHRTHGKEIEMSTILAWCGMADLSAEMALTGRALKRAVYDSFIVSGTQNIQATEISRKMDDDNWDRFSSSIYSGIEQYKFGLIQGVSHADINKEKFCSRAEEKALRAIRVLSKNN
ncbi:MAG: hypothetical protein V7677_12415 [Motiliproteus sp.]